MPSSIENENAYWQQEAAATGTPLTPPKRHPCGSCPWWLEHANQPTEAFPEPGTVDRAWAGYDARDGGARDGLLIMCHRGVPSTTPEAERVFDEFCVCTAAWAVQQREAIRFHEGGPAGVDEDAAIRIGRRMGVPEAVFRSGLLTRADLVSRAHPAVADARLGNPRLAPVRPGEFEQDEALTVFSVELDFDLQADERDRIESVSGFEVRDARTVLVAASSGDLAARWLAARLAPAD